MSPEDGTITRLELDVSILRHAIEMVLQSGGAKLSKNLQIILEKALQDTNEDPKGTP
jgi:hypothetical protein